MYEPLNISAEVAAFGKKIEEQLNARFSEIDRIAEINQIKVIAAMKKNRLSEAHFAATTGYGYNDIGRETLERIYADTFHTEKALVRPQITCGTHALAVAISAQVRPGDEILSPVGKPYDTLEEVIGIRPSPGSLKEWGVTYNQVELLPGDQFDFEGIRNAIHENTKLIEIQRSRGYLKRRSFSSKEIGELIAFIKSVKPDVICLVDNCYGEFTEENEPSDFGADLIVGSLIKNPGGGLAPIGGYIAGKEEYVNEAAYRLSAPGLGQEVGANLGILPSFLQGFFLAPTVTANAMKTAVFAATLYETLGYEVSPKSDEERHDIVQSIDLNSEDALKAFCFGIQNASPVDSFVSPVPWPMPGYDSEVIMAAGTFVSGSSIELSADGPLKPPYRVYLQGGLTYFHGKYGILNTLQQLVDAQVVKLPVL